MTKFLTPLFIHLYNRVEVVLYAFSLALFACPIVAFGQFPTDFQKVELLTGLKNSVNMEFAPDGRIFILDRYGEVIIYKPDTQSNVSAGTLDVFHDMEEGLLAIAFDPEFETNSYIYLHYSHPLVPKNRVSRFTMNGDLLNLSSEIVLLEWTQDRNGYYHAAGDMDFDSQGNLFIAIGDNTDHSKYATLDEVNKHKSSERTSSNSSDLRGKILRIKPLPDGSYSIPEGNLFPEGVGGLPEIYVMGARNPFKIFVDKTNTDWLFWAEVGPDASSESHLGPEGKDEINLTKEAGNYGWPYFSGKNIPYLNTYATPNFYYDPSQPVNLSRWNSGAINLPPAQPSWLDFFHQCYFAGPRYYFDPSIENLKKLPSDFDEVFFYYDFNKSKIWGAKLDAAGNLQSVHPFLHNTLTGAGFIDLKIGPDGQMYILEYGAGCCPDNVGTGKLVRLDFTGIDSNRAPQVNISADVTSGSLPLTVNFSSEGTFDPDGDALLYEWDFQSDGIVDSNERHPTFTYTEEGSYNAQLRVNDSKGGISSKSLTIGAGNNAATFQFVYPPNGGMIGWWDNVDYEIVINDVEDGSTSDGTIDCSQLNLIPSFGHLSHSHDGLTINNCKGTFFLDPSSHDTEGFDDIYYIFKVNYTDSGGLTSFDQIIVHPKLMEAEFYDLQSNTQLIDNSDILGGGKSVVRALVPGSYIMLDKRNLQNIDFVSYRVASGLGGNIEVRVGSPEGALISTVSVPNTGGVKKWIDVEAPIDDPGGRNDLYFVFTNSPGTSNLFDINYIEFKGPGVSIDETPPHISLINVLSPNRVSVKFNEPIQKSSAEQVSNYLINNGISISSAALQADRKTVFLTTSEIPLQENNELTVSNVVNESGLMIYQSIKENFTFKGELLRINAGGPALDINGTKWGQNQYNTGGSTYTSSIPIANTTAAPVYQTEINGNFTYNIPVPKAGIYDLSLHFAELYHQTIGARVFNVDIENGQFSLNNYDIFSNVGYATAEIKRFYGINVEDGFLTLKFTSIQNKAKISGIEVMYGKETVQQPSLKIIEPKNNTNVIQPFPVHFQVSKWKVGEDTTHIHKFVNGEFMGEVYSVDPLTFDDLPLGQHEIQLVLANADHSLSVYQDKILVNVVEETACLDLPFPTVWTENIIGSEVPYRSVYIYAEDLDGDGFKDLVTGGWWYKNPGSRGGSWIRKVIGAPLNNMSLIYDFDNDGDLDIFGTQGTYTGAKMAWAENDGKGNFTVHTNIPDGTSTFGETFMAGAALGNFNGVENTQIALVWNGAESSNSPVQMLTVPADPVNQQWTIASISQDSYGEGISAGDIDGDGDLDLFQGGNWLRNDNGTWTTIPTWLTLATHFDRNALADLDQDGKLEGVVTQIGNGQEIAWFKPQDDPTKPWNKEVIGTGVDGALSLNLVDIDGDGDLDILTGEWKGAHRLLAFENDLCNTGAWIPHVLHPGGPMDHHDSAITADLDNDGYLDIFSIGWDKRVPRIYWNNANSGENLPPYVSNPIPDQKATTGIPYLFTFPDNTFTDPEGQVLSYTASLPNGEALPSWLSFDSLTRTFSGTPLTTDIGSTVITVTASDSTASISDSFILAVEIEGSISIRTNSGGASLTAYGYLFSADNAFQGGTVFSNDRVTDILGTTEDELYKSERFGAFNYNEAVPEGNYLVRLHFAELYFGAPGGGPGGVGKRVFNVTAEGQPILTDFDIYEEVGAMAALIKEFEITVTDGTLNLAFAKVVDNPKISAVEIVTKSFYTLGEINASQDSVQFSQQEIETTSHSKAITLTNMGSVALEIDGISIVGDNADEFGYDFTSPYILGPTASTDVGLTFNPMTLGGKQAQLNISHTGINSPVVVELLGEAIPRPTNQPPVIGVPLPDQMASVGSAFDFTFSEDSFFDPDGDHLAYTAMLSDGSALPGWLKFDNVTRNFSGMPSIADAQTLTVTVAAHDGNNGTVSDEFVIYFEQVNLSPEVVEPIPDQRATVGVLFNFTFGANTFNDPEGDSLIYRASLVGGTALPSWLNFDGESRTFSGIPLASSEGTLEILVTADDGNSGTNDLFVLTVETPNTTAIRINAGGGEEDVFGLTFSADQSFNGGKAFTNSKITTIIGASNNELYSSERHGTFSYNIPVPAGIYSVRLHFAEIWFGATGGGPGEPGRRIFNVSAEGQPLLTNFDIFAEAGSMTTLVKEFEITVNDGTLNLYFAKVVDNAKISAIEVISKTASTNMLPIANAGPDQTVIADSIGFASIQLDGSASLDPDGNIISYSWKEEGGIEIAEGINPKVILPVGAHTLLLTVTDNEGATGTDAITVVVTAGTTTNRAPVVMNPIPDQNVTGGVPLSYTFPQNAFFDPDGDNLTYSASRSNGDPLPNWLTFNGNTRTFSGTPGLPETIEIKVTANDGELEAFDLFNFAVATTVPISIRINAGGEERTAYGVTFSADRLYNGGSAFKKSMAIGGTVEDELYQSERYGSVSYNIPVPVGTYIVRLHFAEIYFGATGGGEGGVGKRVFNVMGEGQQLLTNYDIYAKVGAMTAVIEEFELSVTDGFLNLFFSKVIENPKISAIEVISKGEMTNQVPVAHAGTDQTVMADVSGMAEVMLNGSGSSDPDGTIVSHEWSKDGTALTSGETATVNLPIGTHAITLTVIDNHAATGTDEVTITVIEFTSNNEVPVVNTPIPDQFASINVPYHFTFVENTFVDPDGDPLFYSATLTNGNPLPSWLSFEAASRTFSGTPTDIQGATIGIIVTAEDGKGGAAMVDFILIIETGEETNLPPFVEVPIPDQTFYLGSDFSFMFSENTFTDPEGAMLSYFATLSDGNPLPVWLSFDGSSRTFTGTSAASLGTVEIRVTASDGQMEVNELFNITVEEFVPIAIRVNAGGPEIVSYGATFNADQNFSRGHSFKRSLEIEETTEDELYATERYGSFSYQFPVSSGTYLLRLHFAEIWFGATGGAAGGIGKRVFNVMGEGQALLTNFDIYAEVGAMTALVKEFEIEVTDGVLNLSFEKIVENPKISAIEVISLVGSSLVLPENQKIMVMENDLTTKAKINRAPTEQFSGPKEEGFIKVSPNPFEDIIIIQLGAEEPVSYQVSIYDVSGKVHYQGSITSKQDDKVEFTLNLADKSLITGGLYLLFIESKNGKHLEIFKMIKK